MNMHVQWSTLSNPVACMTNHSLSMTQNITGFCAVAGSNNTVSQSISRIYLPPCIENFDSRHFAVITRVLLINIYSLVIANHSVTDECKCSLTVKHILLECCSLKYVHEKYFTCSSLKELFENFDATTIMDFIKEVNFYHLVNDLCYCFHITISYWSTFPVSCAAARPRSLVNCAAQQFWSSAHDLVTAM